MCGIAGYLADDPDLRNTRVLSGVCDRLAHRGPDEHGYYIDDYAALGHRRLSIIDLSGGRQPLANEDGSVQIVFNGEIYNHAELRRDLLARGHRFATRSDTEVIVHLYEEVKERTPEYLNGMFAFAIWDARERELFLARDRMGKKPLYYSLAAPGYACCFASELKALAGLPGFRMRVDERSVADFLSLSYIPDPETIYQDVWKLPPGHSLRVRRRDARLRCYWQPRFEPDAGLGFDDAVEQIRALAQDVVQSRLMSEVPLGVFLSGGVDSSAVAGIMSAAGAQRVKTFSIGFTDKAFDELEFARMAAAYSRADHHEEVVSPSIHEVLQTLAWQFDEPFGDSSAIPMLYLSRMARRYVTVALCGDGADEIFGGYRRYYYGVLEERLRRRMPEVFRKTVLKAGARYYPKFDYLPQVFRAKTLLSNLSEDLADAYYASMSSFRGGRLEAVLSAEVRRGLREYTPRDRFRRLFAEARQCSPLEQLQWVDYHTYLPGDILVKADRTTMAYSLESRSPWLDYRMVELAGRLPASFKIQGGASKRAFKAAVAPYLPKTLLRRKKMGFSVPLASWFRDSLRPTFESLVLGKEMERYCSPAEVRRIWREHQSGLHNHDKQLWNLLMLACWDAAHLRASGAAAIPELAAQPG